MRNLFESKHRYLLGEFFAILTITICLAPFTTRYRQVSLVFLFYVYNEYPHICTFFILDLISSTHNTLSYIENEI